MGTQVKILGGVILDSKTNSLCAPLGFGRAMARIAVAQIGSQHISFKEARASATLLFPGGTSVNSLRSLILARFDQPDVE